jgi:hypothetical protein
MEPDKSNKQPRCGQQANNVAKADKKKVVLIVKGDFYQSDNLTSFFGRPIVYPVLLKWSHFFFTRVRQLNICWVYLSSTK